MPDGKPMPTFPGIAPETLARRGGPGARRGRRIGRPGGLRARHGLRAAGALAHRLAGRSRRRRLLDLLLRLLLRRLLLLLLLPRLTGSRGRGRGFLRLRLYRLCRNDRRRLLGRRLIALDHLRRYALRHTRHALRKDGLARALQRRLRRAQDIELGKLIQRIKSIERVAARERKRENEGGGGDDTVHRMLPLRSSPCRSTRSSARPFARACRPVSRRRSQSGRASASPQPCRCCAKPKARAARARYGGRDDPRRSAAPTLAVGSGGGG